MEYLNCEEKQLKIIKPKIFPETKVIAGVTERNQHLHPIGFSFCETDSIDHNTAFEHQKLLAKHLGVEITDFAYLKQIHSDKIIIVNEKFKMQEGDGLITNLKGKILVVKIADCAGILVYDPVNEVVSAIHSGWRGSHQEIIAKAIVLMEKNFGSKPEKLLVYISPLASVENYEVGEEVASLFPYSIVANGQGKYYFDNRKEIFRQLIGIGVKQENIEYSELCTISNLNLHSYRRDKEKSGRMAAFIGLRSSY